MCGGHSLSSFCPGEPFQTSPVSLLVFLAPAFFASKRFWGYCAYVFAVSGIFPAANSVVTQLSLAGSCGDDWGAACLSAGVSYPVEEQPDSPGHSVVTRGLAQRRLSDDWCRRANIQQNGQNIGTVARKSSGGQKKV
jgi:hypothetical protein